MEAIMKSASRSKRAAILLILSSFLIFWLGRPCMSQSIPEAKSYSSEHVYDHRVDAQPRQQSVSFERIDPKSGSPFGFGGDQPLRLGSKSVSHIHPGLADAGNDYLLRSYEEYVDGSPLSTLYWTGSDDDGASWSSCCSIDLYGSTYPSVDYWGTGTTFYGAFVPPENYHQGGAFMLIKFPDPLNPYTWSGWYADYSPYSWRSMKMIELACDNGKQDWNWGFISAILTREYPPPDTQYNVTDGPVILYQVDSAGNAMMEFYLDLDNCQTTSCDIDSVSDFTYAVYDRFDDTDDQYKLLIRQDIFGDFSSTSNSLEKSFTDPNQHIRFPVVAAYNNHIVVIAATYNDSLPDDYDIICWYTGDANINHLTNMSTIAHGSSSENFPEISHRAGDTYVCTFIEGGNLYASKSLGAGAGWSVPVQVNGVSQVVAEEYRAADISEGGEKVMYEYSPALEDTIYLGLKRLDSLDNDGDGVYFYQDNCPSISNPGQQDSDGDGFGDACDNCPNTPNYSQADSDNDGLGDACDSCPYDPLNDIDNDGVCGDVDNCPGVYNPNQSDNDNDGVGDFCDNCMTVSNPNQANSDADSYGDACDNCPLITNENQLNSDSDEHGDACDNCKTVSNSDQANSDTDSLGNACDNCPFVDNNDQLDDDLDGRGNVCDNCPDVANSDQHDADEDGLGDLCDSCTDTDGDGYGDPGYPVNTCPLDNCYQVYNPDQTDSNGDGIGDACDYICGDVNNDTNINLLDITYLINYIYRGGAPPLFPNSANVNNDAHINILDITYLINYVYRGGPDPVCP
jgi:hypothetical protein